MDQQTIQEIKNLKDINNNIKNNVKLSLLIYKQINNFDRINIHNILLNGGTNKK